MNTKKTVDFLNDLKAKHGLKSNYALAKFLDQTDTTIARWMQGKVTFSDETAMHIADLLDLDAAYVVACVHAERAKHDSEKKLWSRIAEMTYGLAAVLAVVAFLPTSTLPHWDGMNIALAGMSVSESDLTIIYIMRTLPDYWPVLIPLAIVAFLCYPKAQHDETTAP